MSVEQRAAAIALALADLGLRPLVIGGHAVRFHGVDRSTIDYDFCLAVDLSGWRDLAATLQRSPVIAGAGFREGTSWRPGSFKRFVLGALPDGREERLEFWRRNHLLAPFEELYARRSEGLYGGGRLAFIGLDDLIRSKETEREDDWRDVGLLEEIADERKLAAADSSDGRLQALRALRSRRGFDRALSTGLLGDSQAVRAAIGCCHEPDLASLPSPLGGLPSSGRAPGRVPRRPGERPRDGRSGLGQASRPRGGSAAAPPPGGHGGRSGGQGAGSVRRLGTLTGFLEDAAHALRTLRRRPQVPLLGALGLSIGLGVAAATFSLLDSTLLRPLPGASPRELVAIHSFNKKGAAYADVSYPDFKDLADDTQALAGALAYFRAPLTVATGEKSRRVSCELVSSSYFRVLGLPPAAGRTFLDKEGEPPDRSAVVVISAGLARREYGEAEEAIGKTVRISGRIFQIIGVAPRSFQGIAIDRAAPPEVWVPLWATGDLIAPFAGVLERRDARFLRVVGRLKPGQATAEATRAVKQRAERLEQEHPETNRQMTLLVAHGAEARVSPQLRKRILGFAGIVTGVVAFLVLVVSSNVGHLLLLNAWRRSTELALREALGAEPKRIVRQLAIESAMIATAGFAGALATAAALLQVLGQAALPFGLPQGIDVQLDRRMVLLTLALAIATNLVFGLGAATVAGRVNWREALHSGKGISKPAAMGTRLSRLLLGGQVALSLILLVGGTVFQRTVLESLAIDPGFQPEAVTLLSVDLNSVPGRYDETTGTSYYTTFTNRIQSIPGVKAAAWSGSPPLGARRLLAWWREASGDPWIQTDADIVGPRYFKTMGIGIKRGRDFQPSDDQKEDGKAIISESMAKHWRGTDPIGKKILVRGRKREVYEIVGIALNVRRRSLWEEPGPFVYLPLLQRYFPEMTAHVKADRVQELAEILKSQDADVPVELRQMEDVVKGAVSDQRFAATLLGASGAIGALIAVLGLYAATAYVVTQRTHELAIRSVLGATRRQALQRILTECGLPVAAGLAAGIGMAVWLSRFVTGFVHGISALDPVSFVVASSALAATCFVAVYVPASKATRLDPLVVLRAE